MTPTLEATETERIPADATVCHYDQLTGDAKHALPGAVTDGTAQVPWRAAEQFAAVDVVKFTAYYRVSLVEFDESAERSDVSTASTQDTPTRSTTRPGTPGRRTPSGEPVPR